MSRIFTPLFAALVFAFAGASGARAACTNAAPIPVIVLQGATSPTHITIVNQTCSPIADVNLAYTSTFATSLTVTPDSSGYGYNLTAGSGVPNMSGSLTFSYNPGGGVGNDTVSIQIGNSVTSMSTTSP
jgi:hypothetical protein